MHTPSISYVNSMKNVSHSKPFNPFQEFYGNPRYDDDPTMKMIAKSGRLVSPDLPAAYVGENKIIPSRIIHLVLTTDNWYTQIVSPFERIEGSTTYRLDKLIFDAKTTQMTPHKVPVRLVDHRTETQVGGMEREGLGYQMEYGFLGTDKGRMIYANYLIVIANALINKANISIIKALLQADKERREKLNFRGMFTANEMRKKIEEEIELFAITQKKARGLSILDTKFTDIIRDGGGKSDSWILSPNLKSYQELVPPHNLDYYLSGSSFRGSIDPDDSSFVSRMLEPNTSVFFCRMKNEEEFYNRPNLLASEVEIGQWYFFKKPFSCAGKFDEEGHSSCSRSMKIYDEPRNRYQILSLHDLLDNCNVFPDREFPVLPPHDEDDDDGPGSFFGNADDDIFVCRGPDGRRRPIRRFGQLKERHFSSRSCVDFCRTAIDRLKKTCNLVPSEARSIISEGVRLSRKIGEKKVDPRWFFNVMVQHFIDKEYTEIYKSETPFRMFTALEINAENLNKEMKKYAKNMIKSITQLSKRSKKPMRIMSGNSGYMNLPKYNYAEALNSIKKGDETLNDGTVLNDQESEKRSMDLRLFFSNTADYFMRPGGDCEGCLVGFGNYEGFLAMQNEYSKGHPGESNGSTANGYSAKDCKIASDFVDLIKKICREMTFLFEGSPFFDSDVAYGGTEDPHLEHVVCDTILNMGGLSVWMDCFKIQATIRRDAQRYGNFPERKTDATGNGTELGILLKTLMQASFRNDEVAMKDYQILKVFLDGLPKDANSDSLKKSLGFYFSPFRVDMFENNIAIDVILKALMNKKNILNLSNVIVLKKFYPFCNLTPLHMDYAGSSMREILLKMACKLMDFKPSNAKKLFNDFFLTLDRITGLGSVYSNRSVDDLQTKKRDCKELDFRDKGTPLRGITTLGYSVPSFDSISPMGRDQFEKMMEWYHENIENSEDDLSRWDNMLNEAIEKDRSGDGEEKNVHPIFKMAGFNLELIKTMTDVQLAAKIKKDRASDTRDDPLRGFDVSIGGKVSDKQDEEEMDLVEKVKEDSFADGIMQYFATGNIVDRFYRTPMTLSAKQIESLKNMGEKESIDNLWMTIRPSDPHDPDASVDGTRIKDLSEKIRKINSEASKGKTDGWNSEIHPRQLYYPENWELLEKRRNTLEILLKPYGNRKKNDWEDSEDFPKKTKGKKGKRPGWSSDENDDASTTGNDPFHPFAKKKKKNVGGNWIRNLGNDYSEKSFNNKRRKKDSSDPFDGRKRSNRYGRDDDDDEDADGNVSKRVSDFNDLCEDGIYKIYGTVFLTSWLNYSTLKRFIDHDVLFVFGGAVLRPFQRYVTYSGIKLLKGKETCKTLHGHDMMMLSNDGVTGMHTGSFVSYMKPVVMEPNNVAVARNIFVAGTFEMGAGTRPINPEHFRPGEGDLTGDLMYVILPLEEDPPGIEFDIKGNYEQTSNANYVRTKNDTISCHSQNWRFNQTYYPKKDQRREEGNEEDYRQSVASNTVVVRGYQLNYSGTARDFTEEELGYGHLGQREGPGSKQERQGGYVLWGDRSKGINVKF